MAVRCGFMTVGDVIAKTADGADLEDIFKARAREMTMMKDLGLVFDTDSSQVTDKGQAQPADPTTTESGDSNSDAETQPTDNAAQEN
jgi:capsid protein